MTLPPPSFIFRVEEIAEDPLIQTRIENGSWKPPINPGWSYSLKNDASSIYWYFDGHKIRQYNQALQGLRPYKKYSMYYSEGHGFWVLKGDARNPPADDDWHDLCFDTYDGRYASYLTNAGQHAALCVQPQNHPCWARFLLPKVYHGTTPPTPQHPGGLVGDLPIFLGLMAFTVRPGNVASMFLEACVNGRWVVHSYPEQRTHRRGMVITVYQANMPDSTADDLYHYELGDRGHCFF